MSVVLDAKDPNGCIALAVLLLHVVVDRHTYHCIYNILNKAAPMMLSVALVLRQRTCLCKWEASQRACWQADHLEHVRIIKARQK